MDQTALENGAAADLSRHLQKGSTGRLSVDARGVDVDVYVMNGSVVAAEASDDIKLLLRRLYAAKALSRARITELGGQADMGESVFGLILEEVDGDSMETALFERFRDNVSRFLGVRRGAEFHSMGAVFVENFQMGHDTSELLLQCAKLWRQSRHVPLSMVLAPKHTEDATQDQLLIAEQLDGRRSVRQILHDVPLEPIYGRAVIAGMLANGIASKVKSDTVPPVEEDLPAYEEASTLAGDPHSMSQPSAQPWGADEDVGPADTDTYEPTVLVDTSIYSRDVLPTEQDLIETEVVEQQVPAFDMQHPSDEVWDDYLGAGLEMLDEPSDYRRGLPADTDPEFLDEDSPTVMADYDYSSIRLQRTVEPPSAASASISTSIPTDPPEEHEEPEAQSPSDSAPAASAPTNWLSNDIEFDDDILEAFADHDQVRGGHEGEGAFTQDHLDRVEVGTLPPPEPDPEPTHEVIEVGGEPTARFGARVLSDEEARNKVDVANDNVGELVRAFDAASGSGRGRAAVQLLLEGCPSKFAPLFHDVVVRPDGTLPVDRVLRNLNVRPETEHRQLLNQGLVDLIERGLSLVMDEVEDDDAIDAVLESTAGYRQRIGL